MIKLSYSENYSIDPIISSKISAHFFEIYFQLLEVAYKKQETLKIINNIYPYKNLCFFTHESQIKQFKNGTTIEQILNKPENNTIIKYKPFNQILFLINNEILAKFNIIPYLKEIFNKPLKTLIVCNGINGIESINYQSNYHNIDCSIQLDVYLKYPVNQYDEKDVDDANQMNSINNLRKNINFKDNYIDDLVINHINDNYHLIFLTIKQIITKNGDISSEIEHQVINLKQLIYGMKQLATHGSMIINLTSVMTKFNADLILLMKQCFNQVHLYVPDILPKSYIGHLYLVMMDFKGITNVMIEMLDKLLDDISKLELGTATDLGIYKERELFKSYYNQSEINNMDETIKNKKGIYLNGLFELKSDNEQYDFIKLFNQYYYYEKIKFLNEMSQFIKMPPKLQENYLENHRKLDLIESICYTKKYNLEIIQVGSPNKLFNIRYGELILDDLYEINNSQSFKIRSPNKNIKIITKNKEEFNDIIADHDFNLSLNNLILNVTGNNSKINTNLNSYVTNDLDLYLNSNFTRVITDKYPRIDYIEHKQSPRTTIYLEQRKLVYSEIEFFNLFLKSNEKNVVIYTGIAPGSHISLLKDMFPNIIFILYDTKSFDTKLNNLPNIYVYQEQFTIDTINKIKKTFTDHKIYFISNIKIAVTDIDIENELIIQKEWIESMQPEYSMIKYRLPRTFDDFEYLDGDIYLPIWSPIYSTETILIIKKGAGIKKYNIEQYEGQLQYFNKIARVQYYPHNYNIDGFDHCYDCYTELKILEDYYQKYHKIKPGNTLNHKVTESVLNISKLLGYKHPNTFKTYDKFLLNKIIEGKSKKSLPSIKHSAKHSSKHNTKKKSKISIQKLN